MALAFPLFGAVLTLSRGVIRVRMLAPLPGTILYFAVGFGFLGWIVLFFTMGGRHRLTLVVALTECALIFALLAAISFEESNVLAAFASVGAGVIILVTVVVRLFAMRSSAIT